MEFKMTVKVGIKVLADWRSPEGDRVSIRGTLK